MKKKIVLTYLFIVSICAQVYPQCGNLIWSDEFNGTTLDNTKWTPQTGNGCPNCGWGNAELQYYTTNTNNLRVENGTLVMEARRDAAGNYTSSRVYSRGKFDRKYGRFEMRAKLPAGTGLWPAFWLLPETAVTWPNSGEIDIMENRGDQTATVGGALHYGQVVPNNRNDGTAYTLPSGNFNDNFHVFAVDWQIGQINWYVDGVLMKSETKTPNSLSPASNNDPWPWDTYNFYILLNLAVGSASTPYTGFQNPNFGLSGKYEIDYVRVYDASQPQLSIAGKGRVFENSSKTYSVPAGAGQTYAWTVPAGATITAGQGTTSITVNWGTSAGGDVRVDITHGVGAACPGKTFFYTKAIQVYKNNCSVTFMNYEGITAMSAGFTSGALSEVNNPGSNAVNSSGRTARYVRNGGQQYDALYFDNCLLDNGTEYASATPTYTIKMDVYTTAPIGTAITLQLGNQNAWGAYPAGVHSAYTATTTAVNTWTTLTFTYVNSPDAGGTAYQNNLDRMVFLFNANSFTNHTYHFDNVRRDLTVAPPVLTITGSPAVATSATGIAYNVTGYNNAGDYFLWNVPTGASIASGAGTTAVGVNFGTLGGFVTVQERMAAGCYGPVAKQAVSVGSNSCAIFADEFDNGITAPWLANSAGAGFTHTETISDWKLVSAGHGEWDYIDYTLNDGTNPILLDFNNPVNMPLLKFRARVAASNAFIRISLIDDLGRVANNQYLNPTNGFELTTTSQEFSIDFNGQLWDQYGGGGLLDISRIAKIRISFNPGFVSFPIVGTYRTYNTAFIGTAFIDYIRMGSDCPTPTANFSATDLVVCGTGATNTTMYIDNSISALPGTTYAWNFGAGAIPATATTAGPHTVYYTTPGWKTATLTLNGSVSTRTKTNYVYVSPTTTNCMFFDQFATTSVAPFAAAQGNFTFSDNTINWNVATTGHGEWETFTLDFNDGTSIKPIDFTCPTTSPTVNIRAKASGNVAVRVGIMDKAGIAMANAGLTAKTMELTTAYQVFAIDLTGLFNDAYSAGGPYAVDNTDTRKLQFRVNPGFSSAPWTGPVQGIHNTTFVGSIDIDYISVGTNCTSALPLNFISFEVKPSATGTLFEWVTSEEKNLGYFDIEQLVNGQTVVLGKVAVKGGGNSISAYSSFIPVTQEGVNYYRIAAYDFDGTVHYSKLIAVEGFNLQTNYRLAPNPFETSFELTQATPTIGEKQVRIYSIEGSLVEQVVWSSEATSLKLGEQLAKGLYIVQVSDGTSTQTLRALK